MPLGDLAAMPVATLALIALAVIGSGLGVVVMALAARRAARAIYRARHRGNANATTARLGRELDPRLDLIQRRVDALRHDQLAPAELIALVSDTLDHVAVASQTVKALQVPPEGDAARDGFALELLRASRALESILDACLALEGTADSSRRDRAATVLKWGHVNLIHARASLAERVTQLEEGLRAGKSGWRTSRI